MSILPQLGSYSGTATDAILNIAISLLGILLIVGIYALWSYLTGRIFKKAGVASWKAWVPVYNNWIMLELGGQQGFWAVLAFLPFVGIASAVFMYIAQYNISLKLGKEGTFVLFAIFLPVVWTVWLAIDDSTWQQTPPTAPPQQ